jgi:choline dehydrogenase-like flavoprotein
MALDTFDMIIIGGGTAGLVLAARLSEDPAVQVAVLESGEDHSSDLKVQTPGMWPFLRNSPMDWAFRSSPQVSPTSLEAST